MSSSHPPDTKIMFLEDPEIVTNKICAANKTPTNGPSNGVLCLLRDILIPLNELQLRRLREQEAGESQEGRATQFHIFLNEQNVPSGTVFTIKVEGGYQCYKSYNEIENDVTRGKFHFKP